MIKFNKYFISMLTSIAMLAGVSYGTAVPAGSDADYTWTDRGSTIKIDSYIGSGTSTIIPDSINGEPVTTLADELFKANVTLTNVVIGNNVTMLGGSIFRECGSLLSIIIPDSVTSLDNYCFFSCSTLTNVTMEGNATTLGAQVFDYSPVTIYVNHDATGYSNPWGGRPVMSSEGHDFLYSFSTTNVTITAVLGTKTSYVIPDTVDGLPVTTLASQLFYNNATITNVVIGNNVTEISYECFRECGSLLSIIIPDSVTSLDNYCFFSCSTLTNVTMEGNATTLGAQVFDYSPVTIYVNHDATGYGLYPTATSWAGRPLVWLDPPVVKRLPKIHGIKNFSKIYNIPVDKIRRVIVQ